MNEEPFEPSRSEEAYDDVDVNVDESAADYDAEEQNAKEEASG